MSSPRRTLITRKYFGPDLRLSISRHDGLRSALLDAVQAICTEFHWADVWEEREDHSVLIFSREEVVERSLKSDLKPRRRQDADHLFPLPA